MNRSTEGTRGPTNRAFSVGGVFDERVEAGPRQADEFAQHSLGQSKRRERRIVQQSRKPRSRQRRKRTWTVRQRGDLTLSQREKRRRPEVFLGLEDTDDVSGASALELEALRRDLNERTDELSDSLSRRKAELERMTRLLKQTIARKARLDDQLADELQKYDSAYVSNIRALDREAATLQERLASLDRLRELPEVVTRLEEEAGALQGRIDSTRTAIEGERGRLRQADRTIQRLAARFHEIMLAVQFPNVYENDEVELDPRNWQPVIKHGEQEWGFFDAGSGGKKTLFNVCYALAVHSVAHEAGLPVPSFLIIDSPTKNISEDENPELVQALYREIYRLAQLDTGPPFQFLLIDSDLVRPDSELMGFEERRMAGELNAPRLFSHYEGP